MMSVYYLLLLVLAIAGILWWADRRETARQRDQDRADRERTLAMIAEERVREIRRDERLMGVPNRLERLRHVTRKDLS